MSTLSRRSFMGTLGASALALGGASAVSRADKRQRPNVLFIAIDDLNDWVGFLGGHPQALTPNLDRLAERGVVFENAACQAPICTPSRASLLSGKYPSTSGLYFLSPGYRQAETLKDTVTLPQYFRQQGYRTYGVGKIFHAGGDDASFDLYGGHLGGFGPTPEQKISYLKGHPLWDWGAFPDVDEKMPDYKVAEWAVEKLREPQDDPVFLAVGFWRPHVPMFAPQKWFDMHPLEQVIVPPDPKEDLDDIPQYARDLTYGGAAPRHEEVLEMGEFRHAVQSYLACVTFVDHYVGKVLKALEESPHADNTIIVAWGDHGFHLGEKFRWAKRSLWEESARCPLVISAPGLSRGSRCARPVGMIDLYPTLVDLCGLPAKDGLDGQSLRPLLEEPTTAWERPALTTFGPGNHSLRTERWRYIRYADGSEELYDHYADPYEWHNLAGDARYAGTIEEIKRWLPRHDHPLLEGSKGADSPIYDENPVPF